MAGARSKSSPRTLVIGDVHGCLDELRALVEQAGVTADDEVVFVGDLVSKGPDSAGVIAWARERGAAAVMGNHDEHVLKARAGDPAAKGAAWVAARPLWLHLDVAGKPHVVVHAGLVAGIPVAKQTREHLLTMRSIATDGRPSKRVEGVPWGALWAGPEHAVFGHDAVRGLQQHALATGLDTGCVYGRELTGLLLPEHRLIAVPARRAYAPMK